MSAPTKFHLWLFQSSKKRGKLCIPPLSLDSPEPLLPASGLPDNADRLLPAIMPERTDVSAPTEGRLASAALIFKSSGYIAPKLSNQVLERGKRASAIIEAGTCLPK